MRSEKIYQVGQAILHDYGRRRADALSENKGLLATIQDRDQPGFTSTAQPFSRLFSDYYYKMADAAVIETKEASVVERTPAVAGINGPIGAATNANVYEESPAHENNGGTMEVTFRSSDDDAAHSSVYAEQILDMIAIGSVVSPITADYRT